MKFAVIKTGGKQYKVSEGDLIKIEKLAEGEEGKKGVFDEVLMVGDDKESKIGEPILGGAKVEAEIKEEGRGKKIKVIRFRAKSRHFKKKGHRQPYSKVKIIKISG